MKTIKQLITAVLRKEYRLAVWSDRGSLLNIEGATIDELNKKLADNGINLHGLTWTLYKTGRFFLPEREIDRSTDK